MKIDVLIPAYKPGKEFLELLRMLEQQSVELHKIIIMNTEERYWERLSFENKELAQFHKLEVHHVSQKEFDHGGTRHKGMQYSTADICICMTQDAVPADTSLVEELVKPFEDEAVAVSYARQLPKADAGVLEQFGRGYNYPPEPKKKTAQDIGTMGIKAFFCSDVCAAYRREVYMELGGFVRHTIFNEDMIFASKALQAGYAVYYAADARVLHSHDYGFIQQLCRNFDLGVSQAEYPEVFAGISSEKEGKNMILTACRHFIKIKKPWEIIHLVWQSAAKYIGYFLGKHYRGLPESLVMRITTNQAYWHRN